MTRSLRAIVVASMLAVPAAANVTQAQFTGDGEPQVGDGPQGGPPRGHQRGHNPPGRGAGGEPPGGGLRADPDRLKELGVSEDQIAALQEMQYDTAMRRADLNAAVEKAELSLRRLIDSDDADEAGVIQAAQALHEARGELFKQNTMLRFRVRKLLGDEVVRELRPPRRGPGPARDHRARPGPDNE